MVTLANFLTLDRLEQSLKKYFKSDFKIINFDISKKVTTGDQYCSILLKVDINYCTEESNEEQQLCILAKTFPEEKGAIDFAISMNCFETELRIYEEVLPIICSLDDNYKVSPKLFGILSQPAPTVLLEDLTLLGYRMCPSQEGLDLQHCLMIVKKLAYFHAATLAVYEKKPNVIEKCNVGMFSPCEITTFQVTVTISTLKKVCSKIPGLQVYANKLNSEKILQKIYASRKLSENTNVLNHGDVWIKNLMFRYGDDENVQDVLFLDYQLSYFGSPALDLHYFWAVSPNPDVRLNHQEDIFNLYYNEFVKNLVKLQVPGTPPTMEVIKEEFRTRASFGFAATIIFLPVMKNDKPTPWETYLTDDTEDCFRNQSFSSLKYVEQLMLLLPFYDSLGVFD